MAYNHDIWPARNIAVTSLLILQVLIFVASLGEFSQISIFCSVSRNGLPELLGWMHAFYLALFMIGLIGLSVRRVAVAYLIALPVALLYLPFQIWALDAGFMYCDGP